jgi:hypothetical protein
MGDILNLQVLFCSNSSSNSKRSTTCSSVTSAEHLVQAGGEAQPCASLLALL